MHAPAPQSPTLAPADIRRIMVGLMLGLLLSALDMTIVGPALPTIGHELGHFDLLSWVVTSYLVANSIVLCASSWLVELFGRKNFFMACVLLFTILHA